MASATMPYKGPNLYQVCHAPVGVWHTLPFTYKACMPMGCGAQNSIIY